MRANPSIGHVGVALLACAGWSCAQMTQPRTESGDEIGELVVAAAAAERDVWWRAVQRLGELAAGDPALRDEIWRRTHVNTLGMKFVRIESGTFTMGPDVQRLCEMQVAHNVRITRPFYMAVTETTNQQFAGVFPEHKADNTYSPDADSPAVRVRWDQTAEFCRILSEREGATYRLSTEAEWEYACRAGTTTFYSFGVSPRAMPQYGWCLTERTRAAPVALLKPNDWGIYDMHGNVFEWVGDRFSREYYMACFKQGTVDDPQGPQWGRTHVLRSSGWQVDNTFACTCMARFPLPVLDRKPFTGDKVGMRATIGFRVVREVGDSEVGDE